MATRKQPKTVIPETEKALRVPKARVRSGPDNAGYVKPIPAKPANPRAAAELRRLKALSDVEERDKREAQYPALRKQRLAKEKRELARIEALAKTVPRGEYIQSTADTLCERVSEGEDLGVVLKDLDVKFATMCTWMRKVPSFAAAFAVARENQAHLYISQITRIADGATGKGELARLQVDTRKWLASKLLNKLYGDKIVHSGDSENPIVATLVASASDLVAKIRKGGSA